MVFDDPTQGGSLCHRDTLVKGISWLACFLEDTAAQADAPGVDSAIEAAWEMVEVATEEVEASPQLLKRLRIVGQGACEYGLAYLIARDERGDPLADDILLRYAESRHAAGVAQRGESYGVCVAQRHGEWVKAEAHPRPLPEALGQLLSPLRGQGLDRLTDQRLDERHPPSV